MGRALVRAVMVLVCVLATCTVAKREMGPSVDPRKKLIARGAAALSAHNLREHIADPERDYPALDGIVVVFWPDDCWYRHWRGGHGFFGGSAGAPARQTSQGSGNRMSTEKSQQSCAASLILVRDMM